MHKVKGKQKLENPKNPYNKKGKTSSDPEHDQGRERDGVERSKTPGKGNETKTWAKTEQKMPKTWNSS